MVMVPSGVILSGIGQNGAFLPLIKTANKVKSLRHFEKFEDDILCSKVGENSFIFVKKSYPSYQQLRFRKHVLGFLTKNGLNKPFEYQSLATPEFEKFLNSARRNNLQIVPRATTKLVFNLKLRSTALVNGAPLSFDFSHGQKLSSQVTDELLSSPADVLTSRQDIEDRARGLADLDKVAQYQIMGEVPVSSEVNMVRSALEQFGVYYEQENAIVDSQVERILGDASWNDIKTRRSVKNMEELKSKLPDAYRIIFSIRKDDLAMVDKVATNEETAALERAPLSHQFTVTIVGMANGKQFKLKLPI